MCELAALCAGVIAVRARGTYSLHYTGDEGVDTSLDDGSLRWKYSKAIIPLELASREPVRDMSQTSPQQVADKSRTVRNVSRTSSRPASCR